MNAPQQNRSAQRLRSSQSFVTRGKQSNPEMRVRKGAHRLQAPLASVNVFIMALSKVWRQRRDLPDERSQPGERIARFRRWRTLRRQRYLHWRSIRQMHTGRQPDGVVFDDRGDAHGAQNSCFRRPTQAASAWLEAKRFPPLRLCVISQPSFRRTVRKRRDPETFPKGVICDCKNGYSPFI